MALRKKQKSLATSLIVITSDRLLLMSANKHMAAEVCGHILSDFPAQNLGTICGWIVSAGG